MGVRVVGWRRHGMPDDDAIPGFKHDGQGTRRGTRATAPAQIASTARWLCRSFAIAVDVVSLARLRVDARHAARHLATGASRRSTLASGREPSRQRCGRRGRTGGASRSARGGRESSTTRRPRVLRYQLGSGVSSLPASRDAGLVLVGMRGALAFSSNAWLLSLAQPSDGAADEVASVSTAGAGVAQRIASSGVTGSCGRAPRSRRATPLVTAASATAWATDSATWRLKTLGMM